MSDEGRLGAVRDPEDVRGGSGDATVDRAGELHYESQPNTNRLKNWFDFATVNSVDEATKEVYLQCDSKVMSKSAQWLNPLFDPYSGHGAYGMPKPGSKGLVFAINSEFYFIGFLGIQGSSEDKYTNKREELPAGAYCVRTSPETKTIWSPNIIIMQAANLCKLVMRRVTKAIEATFYKLSLMCVGGSLKWDTDLKTRDNKLSFKIRDKLKQLKDRTGKLVKDDTVTLTVDLGTVEPKQSVSRTKVEDPNKKVKDFAYDLLSIFLPFDTDRRPDPPPPPPKTVAGEVEQHGIMREDFRIEREAREDITPIAELSISPTDPTKGQPTSSSSLLSAFTGNAGENVAVQAFRALLRAKFEEVKITKPDTFRVEDSVFERLPEQQQQVITTFKAHVSATALTLDSAIEDIISTAAFVHPITGSKDLRDENTWYIDLTTTEEVYHEEEGENRQQLSPSPLLDTDPYDIALKMLRKAEEATTPEDIQKFLMELDVRLGVKGDIQAYNAGRLAMRTRKNVEEESQEGFMKRKSMGYNWESTQDGFCFKGPYASGFSFGPDGEMLFFARSFRFLPLIRVGEEEQFPSSLMYEATKEALGLDPDTEHADVPLADALFEETMTNKGVSFVIDTDGIRGTAGSTTEEPGRRNRTGKITFECSGDGKIHAGSEKLSESYMGLSEIENALVSASQVPGIGFKMKPPEENTDE